jgi:drug/metabolite transporter (DMT)-like permease
LNNWADFVDSVHYLPLAEATVFRFLVPIVTAWACSIILGTSFTRKELLAGIIALIGVVFIAHPASIFGTTDDNIDASKAGEVDDVTPAQRLIAIGISVLGIFGASGAYTTIRIIGSRAHALISVNYFAMLGTAGSAVALLAIPGIGFTMPHGAREWILLILLGVLGFVLQFLLTAGLQLDKSSKATSMLYSQIVFALIFDWAIWGVLPGGLSLFGGSIVIASTLWSALQKTQIIEEPTKKTALVDEETALLGNQTESNEENSEVFERRASIGAASA